MNTRRVVDLSIVVATCNSAAFIDACLASLADGGVATEIVVVDNASTDATVELVRQRAPGAQIIRNSTNVGHCRAINIGLAAASGEYLMVLDADTVAAPGALTELVRFLRATPDAAIAAPRMLNPDGSVQETARRFPRVANALFGRQTLLTRLFPRNRFAREYMVRERQRDTDPFCVDWVSAACMVFHRSLPDRIGSWDEGFGGYWVDADWCRRAHATGRVYCVPGIHVVHIEQNRPGRRRGARRIAQFHAGAFRLYRKHFTRGVFDPRTMVAAVALACRALLMMGIDVAPRPRRVQVQAANGSSQPFAGFAKNAGTKHAS